jgi:CRP/FNR family cyclic AMP-dependent transcriptional regulator
MLRGQEEGVSGELPRNTFMAALEPAELEDLESRGRRRQFRKGAPLIIEGEQSDRVFAILEGRAKIAIATDDGKEVFLGLRGPGDLVGEFSFIDGEPRSASVNALEPVEAIVLGASDFKSFLETHPHAAMLMLHVVVNKMREADAKLIEFTAFDSVGRVARRLIELAERYGEADEEGGIRINLPLSQEELAGWTGSSREAVSKALGSLRALGWIETKRRGITVLDLAGLRRRAT